MLDVNRNKKSDIEEARALIGSLITRARAGTQPKKQPVKITRQVDTRPIQERIDRWKQKPVINTSAVTNRLNQLSESSKQFVPDVSRLVNENKARAQEFADQWANTVSSSLSRQNSELNTLLSTGRQQGVNIPLSGPLDLESKRDIDAKFDSFKPFGVPVGKTVRYLTSESDETTIARQKLARGEQITDIEKNLLNEQGISLVVGMAEPLKKGTAKIASNIAKAAPEAREKLWGLMNYQNVLKKAGYTEEQLGKISAKQGMEIIKNQFPGAMPKFSKPAGTNQPTYKRAFEDWVNYRRSAEISAINQKQPFTKYDNLGPKAINDIQRGVPGYEDVRKYFDDLYREIRDTGVSVNFKENYVPQLWKNKPEEVEQVFRRISFGAPFTKESVLKSYQEGISAGLTPRFNKVSDLVGWYAKTAEKLKADRKFFDFLESNNYIATGNVPSDWVRITAEGFPVSKTKNPDGGVVEAIYKAPREVANLINNYLSEAKIDVFKKTADYSAWTKNLKLSGGFPSVLPGRVLGGYNAHGFNIAARAVLSRNNPLGGLFDAARWMTFPNAADKFVNGAMTRAEKYSKAGMTMTTSDYSFTPDPDILTGNIVQKAYKVLGSSLDHYFADSLFKSVIPALKIRLMDSIVNDFSKSMDEDTAMREAAKVVNVMLGGLNYEAMGRNKDFQNVVKSILLASDWFEGTLRMTGNTGRAFSTGIRNPVLKPYRIFARNFLLLVMSKMALEYALNGEANSQGLFNVDTGSYTKDGEKRVLRLGGTGIDAYRIPYETIVAISEGDTAAIGRIITNRMAIPLSSVSHLVNNENYFGQTLVGQDKYGNSIPLEQSISGVGSELGNLAGIPNWVGITGNMATGAISPEEALTQYVEAPVRYKGGPSQYKTSQKNHETFKAAGLQGKDLFDAMEAQKTKNTEPSWLQNLFAAKPPPETIPDDPLLRAVYLKEKDSKTKERIREVFKLGLSPAEISKVLEEEGLGSYQEASLVMIAGLGVEDGTRPAYLKEVLQPLEGTDDFEKMALYYAEAGVLTKGILDAWQDEGMSDASIKYLTSLITKAKGTEIPKGKKAAKVEGPSLSQLKIDVPMMGKLNLKAPKLNVQVKPLEAKVPTTRASRDIAVLEDEVEKMLRK